MDHEEQKFHDGYLGISLRFYCYFIPKLLIAIKASALTLGTLQTQ